MNNYPPGVTGLEPQIAGYDSRDGGDVDLECEECEFAGTVESTEILVDGMVIKEWTCPECEHDYSEEYDPRDDIPERDDMPDDIPDWWDE